MSTLQSLTQILIEVYLKYILGENYLTLGTQLLYPGFMPNIKVPGIYLSHSIVEFYYKTAELAIQGILLDITTCRMHDMVFKSV